MWRNRIAAYRQRRQLTQQGLAQRLGIPAAHVSRWERGERLPSVPWAIRLAQALGCHVEDLFWWDEDG